MEAVDWPGKTELTAGRLGYMTEEAVELCLDWGDMPEEEGLGE